MFVDTSSEDAQAIAQTLSGRRDAFEVLVERYLPAVRAYLLSRTGNIEEAADITQETFLKAFRALPSLRASDKFGPWLIAIARNTAQSFFASRTRERLALEKQSPPTAAPGQTPELDEIRSLLLQQVAALPEPLSEVLVLHYYAGSSTREIGALLGISKWAAEKRLQRARRTLGNRLVDQLGGALRPYRARKEDVLAIMVVIRSVIAPHAGNPPPPVQVPTPSSWHSFPWLIGGVAVLALFAALVWNAGSRRDENASGGAAKQERVATAPTVAQTPPPKSSTTGRPPAPTPLAGADIRRPGKESNPDAPKPAVSREAKPKTDPGQGSASDKDKVWFAILPRQDTVREQGDLCKEDPSGKFSICVSTWARDIPQVDYQLEIRNGDGKILRGKIPYHLRNPRRYDRDLAAEDPIYLSDAQVRGLGALEPGKYLMALTRDKARVSNVASFAIDPKFTPAPNRELTLSLLEPPSAGAPALGIQAAGSTPVDPTFTNSAIASADVLIDGSIQRVSAPAWKGPAKPLSAEEYFAVILNASGLSQDFKDAAGGSVKIQVGRHASNTVPLPPNYPDASAWDAGTAHLDQAPASPALLSGAVTGLDGTPGVGYQLKLSSTADDPPKTYAERVDAFGKYSFRSIPSGRYILRCVYEVAELQVNDVDIIEKQSTLLDIAMSRRFHFSGRVQDVQGNPVENATVSASWQEGETMLYRESARTDSNGRYDLSSPISVVTSVHVEKPGYVETARPEGSEKYEGVLTRRNDIDLVVTEGDAGGQLTKDQHDRDALAQAAQQLVGRYTDTDASFPSELSITAAGREYLLVYGARNYKMAPDGQGLLYWNGATRVRFEFRGEDQRYVLVERLPGETLRETSFVRRND